MAQDGEHKNSIDKGKGKDISTASAKPENIRKIKDGEKVVNGKEDDTIGGSRSQV